MVRFIIKWPNNEITDERINCEIEDIDRYITHKTPGGMLGVNLNGTIFMTHVSNILIMTEEKFE